MSVGVMKDKTKSEECIRLTYTMFPSKKKIREKLCLWIFRRANSYGEETLGSTLPHPPQTCCSSLELLKVFSILLEDFY
jgi:hypothetical protein